jgi:20S proteasome subunit beta 1
MMRQQHAMPTFHQPRTTSTSELHPIQQYDLKSKQEVSSGTTIMAISTGDAVILGADSRVSTGTYIANRTSDKIAQLSPHIYCCRSGSAADTQFLTDVVKHFLSQLTYVAFVSCICNTVFTFLLLNVLYAHSDTLFLLLSCFWFDNRIQTGRPVRVKTAAHLMQQYCYEYKDMISAGVIVAGWDPVDGGSVYSIPSGGSCVKVPFALGGSGSLYIYGFVDSEIQRITTQQQQAADAATMGETPTTASTGGTSLYIRDIDIARSLVKKAVSHAMARDGSSGGIIRTVVVTATGNDRDYTAGNELPFGPTGY